MIRISETKKRIAEFLRGYLSSATEWQFKLWAGRFELAMGVGFEGQMGSIRQVFIINDVPNEYAISTTKGHDWHSAVENARASLEKRIADTRIFRDLIEDIDDILYNLVGQSKSIAYYDLLRIIQTSVSYPNFGNRILDPLIDDFKAGQILRRKDLSGEINSSTGGYTIYADDAYVFYVETCKKEYNNMVSEMKRLAKKHDINNNDLPVGIKNETVIGSELMDISHRFLTEEDMNHAINETNLFFNNNKYRTKRPLVTIKAKSDVLLAYKKIKVNTGRSAHFPYKTDIDYLEFIKSLFTQYNERTIDSLGAAMERKS